jgi:opacity protein-like surface antigen
MKHLLQTTTALLLAGASGLAAAQGSSSRAGTWEFMLLPQYSDSFNANGNGGSRLEVDGAWGFGLGLAYNFNERFSLGGEFVWNQADYKATLAPGPGNPNSPTTISAELETSTLRLMGTWNFLPTSLTPFVTGGLGATYVDSNVPDGPPQTYCWYDPFYFSYVCTTGYPTKDETYFSYIAGAGLRWDSQGRFFVRGLAAMQWIDIGGAIGTQDVTQYRIDIGFKF